MRRAKRRPHKRKRAAAMLEFMMVFPMALVIVMFSFDVARVYMTLNGAQYAAAAAVRSGAYYGAAGEGGVCSSSMSYSTVRNEARVLDTFCQKVKQMPGSSMVGGAVKSIEVSPSESLNGVAGACSDANKVVKIDVTLGVPSLVPGLGLIMGVGSSGSNQWNLKVHQEARCEVLVQG